LLLLFHLLQLVSCPAAQIHRHIGRKPARTRSPVRTAMRTVGAEKCDTLSRQVGRPRVRPNHSDPLAMQTCKLAGSSWVKPPQKRAWELVTGRSDQQRVLK
jgi:hypothetical protein